MLTDVSDLASDEVVPTERAFAQVAEADDCALCGAPELQRLASAATTLDWLLRYDPESATAMRVAIEGAGPAIDRWEDVRSRTATDSRIRAAYPWPNEWLAAILGEVLGSELEPIAIDAFLLPICERCFDLEGDAGMTEAIRNAYVRFAFDGNEAAARAQPVWPAVERFLAFLAKVERARAA